MEEINLEEVLAREGYTQEDDLILRSNRSLGKEAEYILKVLAEYKGSCNCLNFAGQLKTGKSLISMKYGLGGKPANRDFLFGYEDEGSGSLLRFVDPTTRYIYEEAISSVVENSKIN